MELQSPSPSPSNNTPTMMTGSSTASDNLKRRSVACKSCHSLKVKCTPIDVQNPFGPCVRCLKAGRQCEIDLSQPRKRKRKAKQVDTSITPETSTIDTGIARGSTSNTHHESNTSDSNDLLQAQAAAAALTASRNEGNTQSKKSLNVNGKDHKAVEELRQRVHFLEDQLQKQALANSTLHQRAQFSPIPQQQQQQQQQFLPSGYNPSNLYPPISQQQHQAQAQAPALPDYHNIMFDASRGFDGNGNTEHSTGAKPHSLPPFGGIRPQVSPSPVLTPSHQHKLESPSNLAVSGSENEENGDGQLEDLQRDLNSLMSSQKASLSELTSDVLKLAHSRIDMINDNYGYFKNDPVSLNLITLEAADERLRVYREIIYPSYPFIKIPDSSADELRKSHRFLFTTLMTMTAMAIPKNSPALDKQMEMDLCNIKALITEVLIIGNKTLELLQCLMLMSLWYNSSELFHHRRYHLINSLCVTMVHDLGLTGRTSFFYNKEEGSVKRTKPTEDIGGTEYRRLLLTVYFSSVSISLFLRRRIQVSWTPYLQECCDMLESTGNKDDGKVSTLSQLSRMLERIHFIVHGNQEPTDSAFMAPDRLKYIVAELQRDLLQIKSKIPTDDHCLISYYYSVQAYLHEPELQKAFTNAKNPTDISPVVVGSIDKCSRSCIAALEQANLATTQEIAGMPLAYSSRLIYTAGMLLRLRYMVISIPFLCKRTYFPRSSIEQIQSLAKMIYLSSQEYSSNNFLQKMRLVIALFSQTYLTQLHKLMDKKPPDYKWQNDPDIQSLHLLSQAAAAARNENLSTAFAKATSSTSYHHSAAPSASPPANSNNNNGASSPHQVAPTFNHHPINTNSPSPAMADHAHGSGSVLPASSSSSHPPDQEFIPQPEMTAPQQFVDTMAIPCKGSSDLEFSYYALNDEFWSDLLLNNDNISTDTIPFTDQDTFYTNFI